MRGIALVHPPFGVCFFAAGPCNEIGRGIGFCNFTFSLCDTRSRTPCNRCAGARIARPVEYDAVGNLRWHGIDRGLVTLILMHASRGRYQKQKNETSYGHCTLLICINKKAIVLF